MHDIVLFDLDGTLIDTAPEIADAVNATLQRHGLPPATRTQVRAWIGEGNRALLGKAALAAGVPRDRVADWVGRAWQGFEYDYLECCGTSSVPYPGVRRALGRLRAAGVHNVLLTNKESAFAHRLLVRHDMADLFDLMVCGDTLPTRKPDPAGVFHALSSMGASTAGAVLIGDSVIDLRTARAAGIPMWAVRHGYGLDDLSGQEAPDCWIDHFGDLAEAVASAREARVSIF